jgi:hypothetical protein
MPEVLTDPRRAIRDKFLEEATPYMAAKCRLEGKPWAVAHVAALDDIIDRILERLAKEHDIPISEYQAPHEQQ